MHHPIFQSTLDAGEEENQQEQHHCLHAGGFEAALEHGVLIHAEDQRGGGVGRAAVGQHLDLSEGLEAVGDVQEQAKDLEKRAIGKLAASLVQEGDILFMGSGNTVLEVARNLRHLSSLTVITSSLSVINELSTTGNTIYILGGRLDYSEQSIEIQDSRLESFCTDKAFISCDGVTLTHGVTASYPPNVRAGQLMVKNAKEAILVANSRKFGNNALSITCKLSELSTVVSDDGLSEEYQKALLQQGVSLMLASVDDETKN